MGNMLILPGANFKEERTRGASYQKINFETVYDNAAVLYRASNSVTNLRILSLNTISSSDFAAISPNENVDRSGNQVYMDAMKCCQVSIPSGAVGFSGITTAVRNTHSTDLQWNGIPFAFRSGENGKMVTDDFGLRWYMKSDNAHGSTDEVLLSDNTALNSCIKSLRILNRIDGLFQNKYFTGWLVELTAAIHPQAESIIFNWVKPAAITTVNSTSNGQGNSTIGIGMVEPELYWIYE